MSVGSQVMSVGYGRAFASYAGPQKKPVIDGSLLREISEVACLENQACARKVALAAAIWDSCVHQTVQIGEHIMDAGNYAASETAKALGCSKTVADTLADVGMDLRLRLPAVKAAFEAGELDLARVRAIYRTTNCYSLEAAQRAESEILHAARRMSSGPLATEIAATMQRIAPDETAELRKKLASLTRVRSRHKDVLATIEADLEAADAAACWQLINEMAATVCNRDPRTRNQRLAAAYSALLRREEYLPCSCTEDEDHPCSAKREVPDRRAPLTTVTIDLTTLAGLSDLPGYLAGHGLIDAEYARELAANGDWQLILTEASNLAAKLGVDGDKAAGLASSVGLGGGGAAGTPVTFHPLGRGLRRRGSSFPERAASGSLDRGPKVPVGGCYRGSYTLIAAMEAAIASNPALAEAVHPDGHGGFTEPPAGALSYRPSAALADCVRHRDRTCRHPGCDVPAASCEIDHVVPYRHRDPARGGWTVSTNLHCLCRYHHMLKTMGVWIPRMLAGGADYWVSSSGTTAITLPGSVVGTADLSGESLIPHIPRKRLAKCSTDPAEPAVASATAAAGSAADTADPAPF